MFRPCLSERIPLSPIKKALLFKSTRESLRATACLSLNKKQATDIQEEEIKVSINLFYVEGTSEKLRLILRTHKMISTFYTENTLLKLLYKSRDLVATEDYGIE